jgi:hypothetical protein
MKLPRTLKGYVADARGAFRLAPLEIALGLLLGVSLSVLGRIDPTDWGERWGRIAVVVALAFPLVLAFTLLAARGVVTALVRWAGSFAALAGAALFELRWDPEIGADWWRFWLLLAAFVVVLLLAAALPLGPDPDRRLRVWSHAFRLLRRGAGVLGYAALLHLALVGAVAAVVALFDLGSPRHLYRDLPALVYFVLAPWIFVGGIGRITAPYDPAEGRSPLVDVIVRYFSLPVLALYGLILYAYTIKVAATGEIPRNLLSPLVLGAGAAGFVAALLAEPYHSDPAHRGTSRAFRWFPALLLPLVPLAAWAVALRVSQYGWTEFRFVRAALLGTVAVLAVLGTIRLVRRRPPLLTTTLGAFAAVFLLSAVGPWSAPEVSLRDQRARLWAGLRAAGLDDEVARSRLARGGAPETTLDSAAFARIVEPARYLARGHGTAALLPVFAELPDTVNAWALPEHMGLVQGCPDERGYRFTATVDWSGGAEIAAGGRLYRWVVDSPDGEAVVARGSPAEVRLRLRGDSLVAAGAGWRTAVNLGERSRALAGAESRGCQWTSPDLPTQVPLTEGTIPLRAAPGRDVGTLLLTSWNYHEPPPDAATDARDRPGVFRAEGFVVVP